MKYNMEAIEVVKDFTEYYKDIVDMLLENRLDNRGQFIINELYKDIYNHYGYNSDIVNTIIKEIEFVREVLGLQ